MAVFFITDNILWYKWWRWLNSPVWEFMHASAFLTDLGHVYTLISHVARQAECKATQGMHECKATQGMQECKATQGMPAVEVCG